MPKIKTHKGAQKRFKISGSGKLMRRKQMSSHLRLKKPKRVRRKFSEMFAMNPSDDKRIKRVLPYGTGKR
ncbi:MAG: 50S ribosomal protein L35 [SAR202 cluster bacterium]|nr:50S ribosomal protein L35 [SAR202 cluster bacterium]